MRHFVVLTLGRLLLPTVQTLGAQTVADRGADKILIAGKPWEVMGDTYQLTADSAVDKNGTVFFTDAQRNRILKIDLNGRITIWKEGTNDAHGISFGSDGRLYAGQHDLKRIVAFSADRTESVIAEGVQTHHLAVSSRNEIYYTVPPLHRVSMLDSQGRQRVVHEGLKWPRGVLVSADRSQLMVGDAGDVWVWKFGIAKDGSLTAGRQFCQLEAKAGSSKVDSGGMALDSQGWLYVATDIGVQVCDERGRVTAVIRTPGEDGASNVYFAGPKLEWLYFNSWQNVYRRPVQRRGSGPR